MCTNCTQRNISLRFMKQQRDHTYDFVINRKNKWNKYHVCDFEEGTIHHSLVSVTNYESMTILVMFNSFYAHCHTPQISRSN